MHPIFPLRTSLVGGVLFKCRQIVYCHLSKVHQGFTLTSFTLTVYSKSCAEL